MLRQTTHLGTVGPDPTAALLATGNLLKTGEPFSHRLRSEGPEPGEDWERYWVCVFPPPPPPPPHWDPEGSSLGTNPRRG